MCLAPLLPEPNEGWMLQPLTLTRHTSLSANDSCPLAGTLATMVTSKVSALVSQSFLLEASSGPMASSSGWDSADAAWNH